MAMSRRWCIKKNLSFLSILSLMFWSLFYGPGMLAAESVVPEKPGVPISITSEKMTLKNLENRIIFEGAVLIKREGMTVNADRAEVLLSESKQSGSLLTESDSGREVSQIITSGSVRIVRGAQQARAEKGVYKKGEEVFVLTGNPEVWDKDFHVKGKVITFFIDEERTLVSESQAVIYNTKNELKREKKLN